MRTGIDITFVQRFLDKIDDKEFLNRIFSSREQEHINQVCHRVGRLERLAGQFAGKEAVAKALGTGIGDGVKFLDIEILPNENGIPSVILSGEAEKVFNKLGLTQISISIAHDGGIAISNCVMI